MIYIKNNRPTKALSNNITSQEAQNKETPNLSHLRILGSTVYVFLHEEEQSWKSEKWAPRALKEIFVGYNGHTIYRVPIKSQNKVIQVKELQIFEDYETKTSTDLPDYKDTPTFQGFLIEDQEEQVTTPPLSQASLRADNTENAKEPMATTSKELQDALSSSGQKVNNNNGTRSDWKVNDTDPPIEQITRRLGWQRECNRYTTSRKW